MRTRFYLFTDVFLPHNFFRGFSAIPTASNRFANCLRGGRGTTPTHGLAAYARRSRATRRFPGPPGSSPGTRPPAYARARFAPARRGRSEGTCRVAGLLADQHRLVERQPIEKVVRERLILGLHGIARLFMLQPRLGRDISCNRISAAILVAMHGRRSRLKPNGRAAGTSLLASAARAIFSVRVMTGGASTPSHRYATAPHYKQ